MRELKKLSTARCTLKEYVNYLLGDPLRGSCRRLGEIIEITHDSVKPSDARDKSDNTRSYALTRIINYRFNRLIAIFNTGINLRLCT